MWAVCKKELRQFFSSLTGYIAIIVFLLLNGLLLFVFPDTDILAFGYATLDKFFELAPWILLLLIPAITMRSFSDEFRMGTFETLQTVPLTRTRLVLGKYWASLIVVLIALLPTLVYFLCIQRLSGQGGIDTGATIGSYLGLMFLAGVFTAVGIWCSSFTANAVVAFIVAAFACFILYSGFGAISALPVFSAGLDYYIGMLGIDFHYRSVSRGVVDGRDVLFFLSVIFLFLYLTGRHLQGRQLAGPRRQAWIRPVALIAVLTVINLASTHLHYRLDLTQDRRYTLSAPTKELLGRVDDNIQVDFFLAGNLKAGIRNLAKGADDLLQEMNEYCDGKIRVHAFDPLATLNDTAKAAFLDSLQRMGIQPMTQVAQVKKGEEESQRIVIPAAIVRYKGRIFPVNLLTGVKLGGGDQAEQQLYSNAETLLEYKFGSAIDKVTAKDVPRVGYVLGNGEPLDYRVYDLIEDIRHNYRFGLIPLDSAAVIPTDYKAIVIVKPTIKFTEREKLTLDQYVLHGGQIIWAVDALHAEKDSLRQEQGTIAYDRGLDLEDIFFRYGVRLNKDLVEDGGQSANLSLVVGMQGNKPQIEALKWPYYPLLNGSLTHPISKNLDPVLSEFANSIDTVSAPGIKKTVLLQTSANSRRVSTPALITLDVLKYKDDMKMFPESNIPVAMLLEGKFRSLFANRLSSELADSLANVYHTPFLPEAKTPSRVIVCSDGDIFINEVTERGPLPLGFSADNNYTFANKDFIENCLEYMVNPSHILETRSKDFTLRLLDPAKVESDRAFWQFINIGLPIVLVVLGGYVYQLIRRRKFAKA
ncbi:gliding motility-associated ABC transporter substrate-binding protein GldG [Puia sp.]|jgi:ABC-2 type transport system permease protein|uniref:gliding motility-associated ABC transporter substrate-binding protein GldG n=1 Tax=Puia sp. TaxID=2045100 RepID=UPI002F3FC4C7